MAGVNYVDNVPLPSERLVQTKDTSSGDDGLISKEIMKMLVEKGIPTDVDKFYTQLANFERQSMFGSGINKRALYSLQAEANRIIQQANYLDEAKKFAEKNNSIGEIAVGSSGQLYTMNKNGDIRSVVMSKYNIEKDGPALTVGELITLRLFNPTQAFDVELTSVINSNIGTQKINDYIKNILTSVGEATNLQEAYTDLATLFGKGVTKPTLELFETILRLYNEYSKIGSDAIFKLKESRSSKLVNEAMEYIMKMLPRDMQILLRGRFVGEGNEFSKSGEHVTSIIGAAIAMNNDQKIETGISYDHNLTPSDNTGKKSSKTFYQTPNEAFFSGDLNQTDILLSDPKNGNLYGITLKGNTMPALTTDKGNAISNVPMNIALNETVGKYLNKNHIYMGELKLNGEAELGNIAYASDEVAQVYVPTLSNGDIDWQGFHSYAEAEDQIRTNHVTDPELKNQIHAALGSYARYGADGKLIVTDSMLPYLMTYGYTIDDHVDSENSLATELDGDAEDAADTLIESIFGSQVSKKAGYDGMKNKQFWDDIFKVPIFIKINQFAGMDAYRYGGHGSNMTPRTLQEDMIQELLNTPVPQELQIVGNSSLLYLE